MKVSFWSYSGMVTDEENQTEADVYHRITLEPGESFTVSKGGEHEEGYTYEFVTYIYEYNKIRCEISIDSRDCDGQSSFSRTLVCDLDKLESYENYGGIGIPDWKICHESQRDYSAEKAGY